MKRSLILLAVLFLLLGVFVQSSLAYSYVKGCVVDGKTGQPWAHGGTVTITWPPNGTKTEQLDANGCFGPTSIAVSAFGNPAMTATIDLNPGPAGDPSDIVCNIPEDDYTGPTSDDRAVFVCPDDSGDPMPTDTGPNAVLLMKMGASPDSSSPLATLALAGAGLLGILGLGVFWRRRLAL